MLKARRFFYTQGLLLLTLLLACANVAHAFGCGDLFVQIANETPSACYLVKQEAVHGRLKDDGLYNIPAGYFSQTYIAQHNSRGPNLIVVYQCGSQTMVLRSQQNYCFMKAGKVNAEWQSSDPSRLLSIPIIKIGSYINAKAGYIGWRIISTGDES